MPSGYGGYSSNLDEKDPEDDVVQLVRPPPHPLLYESPHNSPTKMSLTHIVRRTTNFGQVGSSKHLDPALDRDLPPRSREEKAYLPQERASVRPGNPLPTPGSRKSIPGGIVPRNSLHRADYGKRNAGGPSKRKYENSSSSEFRAPHGTGPARKQQKKETSLMPPIFLDIDDEDVMFVKMQKSKNGGGQESKMIVQAQQRHRSRSSGTSTTTREIPSPSTSPQERSKYFPTVSPLKFTAKSDQKVLPRKTQDLVAKTPVKSVRDKSDVNLRLEQDVEELEARTLKKTEESPELKENDRRSTHGTVQQSPMGSRWNSGIDETGYAKWSGKKNNFDTIIRKLKSGQVSIPLVCFQRGIGSVPKEGEDGKNLSLQFHMKKLDGEIRVMDGEKEIEELRVMVAKIKSVQVNEETFQFGIQFTVANLGAPNDNIAMFTLRDLTGVKTCKEALKNAGISCGDAAKRWFENQRNQLRDWDERLEKTKAREAKEKVAEALVLEVQKRRILGINPKVEITPRKSMRGKIAAKLEKEPEKTDRVPEKPKRTRSPSPDREPEKTRELRLTKIRKLDLPKPKWKRPLIYPFEGPKKETVDYEDLDRLNSEEFLNDNLINFYLRYLEVQLQKRDPELAKETHFLNTFFYERLTRKNANGKRNFEGVMKWTAKVDLFKTNYIIIPINESTHWYLAIICNLQHLERKLQKEKTPDLPEDNKSVDLESTVTLLENTSPPRQKNGESDSGTESNSVIRVNPAAESSVMESLKPSPEGPQKNESDVEMSQTQDDLEHMSLNEGSGLPKKKNNNQHDLLIKASNRDTFPRRITIEVPDSQGENNTIPQPADEVPDSQIETPALDPPKEEAKTSKAKGKQKEKSPQKSKQSVPPDTPAIIILDSISYGGPSVHPSTIRNLKEYLTVEARIKRQLEVSKSDINAAYAKVPGQTNWFDCGLYLLYYVKRFLEQPKDFVAAFLAREDSKLDNELWRKEEIKGMRSELFRLIVDLHEEYDAFETERRREEVATKLAAKLAAKAAKASTEPLLSSPPPPKKPANDEVIIQQGIKENEHVAKKKTADNATTASIAGTGIESVAGSKRSKESDGSEADQNAQKPAKEKESDNPPPKPESMADSRERNATTPAPADTQGLPAALSAEAGKMDAGNEAK
ncbi:hypothetical protein RUND412_001259 [Rhizina undulata]